MAELLEVPEWERGPRCGECGGAAVPIYEHHLHTKKLPEPRNLACAVCGRTWRGTTKDEERAAEAHWAWEQAHKGGGHRRSEWEARKLAEERAKVERLREGRW